MSLLRSYSFGFYHGVTSIPDGVLSLFDVLVENPEERSEYPSEIISAGLQGRINLNKDFNLKAYEAKIKHNEKLGKEGRKKREVYMSYTDNNDDWDEVNSSGGVKSDLVSAHAAQNMRDAYEELIMQDSLGYAIETIESLRNELIIHENVDIITLMKQALKSIPRSVKLLRRICEDYEVVAEQVEVILNSGFDLDELFVSP